MKKHLLLASSMLFITAPAFAQTAAPVPPPPAAAALPAPVPQPATPATAAPDVQEQINSALAEYQQKHYGQAANMLDAASAQLRQIKSKSLRQFLPAAPQGWTSKEDARDMYSIHLPGMGSEAARTYASGGQEIRVAITTDSKLISAVHKLNIKGAESMQFMGYDYIFKPGDANVPANIRKKEASLFVNDTLTISVSGDELTDQQAQGFIGLIDLAKLKAEAEK